MKKIMVSMFVWMLLIGNVGMILFVQTASAQEPLTISGSVRHEDETGTMVDSRYIRIEAWEKQALLDYKIAEDYTTDGGGFAFTHDTNGNPILNEDSGLGESGTRDIYIKCFAENEAARVSDNWFNEILGATWFAETTVHYDVAGPTWDISIDIVGDNSPAFGLPAMIKADRDWLSSKTGGWTRDKLGVLYPDGDWPGFFSRWFYNIMRIPDYAIAEWDSETISHEYGHGVHYSARGGRISDDVPVGEEDPRDGFNDAGTGHHWIFSESSGGFALSEGWAQFFRNARHGDHQSLETNDYWMGADGNGAWGPNTDGTTGEIVEGAFASILWDLYDGANDDGVNGGFSDLWTVFETDDPDRVWSSSANDDFYHYWINRFGQTREVDEIFIDHGIPVTDDSHDLGSGNDDSAHASNLGLIDVSKSVEDLIVVDVDWYEFTTSSEGYANSEVVILFDKNRGDLDLFVYHSDDTLVGSGIEFPGGRRVSLDGEYPDTFKIKVVGAGDDSGTPSTYEGDFSPDYDLQITPPNKFAEAIVVNKDALSSTALEGDRRAFHVFTSPVGFVTATEGDTFLIMSSGIAENIPGSPGDFESTDFDGMGTAGDTVSLTLEFVVPAGATTLSFDFRFMSEEYPEWVGTQYNDFFYAYLTNSTGTHQVAFDDNGHIININNNFFNPNIYPIGTVFDGATKRLTTTVNVNEGEQITLRFVVGDVGDGIYDTAVFIDNVRFNVGGGDPGTTPTADVIVVKNGPNSVEQGKQLAYTLNYFNIEEGVAENVVVIDNLPPQANFVSASGGGVYSSPTHSVTWNLGTLPAFSSGSLTLTVSIPSGTSVGTILQNTVSISTTSQESNSQNNDYPKSTTVTGGASLPPNVEVDPTASNYNGIPVLYWTTPTTFTYHGDANVIGVDFNIHLPDGGPDIGGPMTNTPGTYDWTFTYTFYPRHGQGIVTYTIHYADGSQDTTGHNILVDPSGYVYNAITGERIEGATVTLFRFDAVLMQFVIVPTDDPGIDPHINPQITDENGGYGWMVSPGMYMVRVEKEGYALNFVIVTVPPPATDLNIPLTPIDATPPTTQIMIGTPHYIDSLGNTYVTSETSFTLTADDGLDGSGVDATYYRHYNLTYDSDWTGYSDPFYLEGLEDDTYSIDYYSTDIVGNVEPTNTTNVTLDNTAPEIMVSNPPAGWALQDGVTFMGSIVDSGSGVSSMCFSIREANGGEGTPIGYEDLAVSYDPITGEWSFSFDTLLVPDGYYVLHIEAEDNLGNENSTTVPYSIRNWAVIKLLPSSSRNKAGRTMPVKFALRVAAEVDPDQPFVYNEELRIDIFATADPDSVLQESYYGDSARDYRISSVLYITNFKTIKRRPMEYTVAIYRESFDVGSFTFETVK